MLSYVSTESRLVFHLLYVQRMVSVDDDWESAIFKLRGFEVFKQKSGNPAQITLLIVSCV